MVLLPFPMSANVEGELSETNPLLKLLRSRVAAICILFVSLLHPVESFSATCSMETSLTCVDSTPCKNIGGTVVCLATVPPSQLPQGALQSKSLCWNAQASYSCTGGNTIANNCSAYTSNPSCGILSSTCVNYDPNNPANCIAFSDTYQCQTGGGVQYSNTDCSGNTFCSNGVCYTKNDKPNNTLGKVVTAMEVSRMAGFYADASNPASPSIFRGVPQWCSENSLGLANCCKPDTKGASYTNTLITQELVKAGWNAWVEHVAGSSYSFDTLFESATGFVDQAITGMTEVFNGTSVATGQSVYGAANNVSNSANAVNSTSTATTTAGGVQSVSGAGTGGAIGGTVGQQAGSSLAANNGANTIFQGVAGAGGYAAGTVGGTYLGAYAYSAVANMSLTTAAGDAVEAVVGICWPCILVMVIMMVIMALLACDTNEIKTQMKLGAKLCHEVPSQYCVAKNELGICLTYRHEYCCFNSKLGRIIQEQGRPQIGMSWGTAQSPNCSGYTVDQLQSLDFSKMDLSEFMADVTANAQVDATALANTVTQRLGNFYASGSAGLTNGLIPGPQAGVAKLLTVTQNGAQTPPPMPACNVTLTEQPPDPNMNVSGTFAVSSCLAGGTAVWNYVGNCPAIPTGSMNQTTGAASNMPMTNIDSSGNTSFTYLVPASCLSTSGQTYFNSWKVMVSDPNFGLLGSVSANWK